MVTGGTIAEAVRSLSNIGKTEVWTQARVSVSRAAITKYCKQGDLKQQKFMVSLFWRLQVPSPGAGRAVLSLKAAGENPSFLSLVCTSFHWVPWLPAAVLWSLLLIPHGCYPLFV